MALQRHNGTGWAGAARATYTPVRESVDPGAPPIWLRARSLWHVTGGVWQSTSPGEAAGADLTAISAGTIARSYNGGPEVVNPVKGDPSLYWESYVSVSAGPTCCSYALWRREAGLWRFMGSKNIGPGETQRTVTGHGSLGLNIVHWCATAWESQTAQGDWIPPGQQGFSRFASG